MSSSADNPSFSGPESTELLARPVDILRIEQDLVSIAEKQAPLEERIQQWVAYLLRLTNARGIVFHEWIRGGLSCRSKLWAQTDSAAEGILFYELQAGALQSCQSGIVVIHPLVSVERHFTITVPWIHKGRVRGSLGLALVAKDRQALQPFLVTIQTALGFLHYTLLYEETAEGLESIQHTSVLVELSTKVAEAPFFQESLRVLTEELQRHLGCHNVSIGLVRKQKVRVATLSGATHFDSRSHTTHLIAAAMREALLHGSPVRWPTPPNLVGRSDLSDVAQQELCRALHLKEVVSIPLTLPDSRYSAVLTVMWDHEKLPTPATYRFLEAASPHLGILIRRLRQSDPFNSRKWKYHLWGRLSRNKRLLVASLTLLLIVILAWPVSVPLRVDCQLQPVLRRVVSAPFDGILKRAYVEPGQEVTENELLAVLDERELQWKHAELSAARDRAVRQRDLAITDPESPVAASHMAQFEIESLELELKLIEYRQQNLELRSPLQGIVLAGDLRRAEGIPLKQGQVLFEVGPAEQMIVELLIPAEDISQIRENAETRIRLASFPGKTWHTHIRTIRPQAEVLHGRNLFVAEGTLVEKWDSEVLRAGMKGRASIHRDSAPIGWILTRRLWDFIHLHLFW